MEDTELVYQEIQNIDPDLVENASDLEELIELILFFGFPAIL
tara:strand:+ start:542 stop:667 length:126 start_codon:yes stop_codon:yes gene_type:complete